MIQKFIAEEYGLNVEPVKVVREGKIIFDSKYIRVYEYINKHGHKIRYCLNKKRATRQPERVHGKALNRHVADRKIYKENMEVENE